MKSTGGDWNTVAFSNIGPKLEFEHAFLEFPRVLGPSFVIYQFKQKRWAYIKEIRWFST